jgi:UDP-N-acetylglucosamine 2-epimerase
MLRIAIIFGTRPEIIKINPFKKMVNRKTTLTREGLILKV